MMEKSNGAGCGRAFLEGHAGKFDRARLLLGDAAMAALARTKVLLFGTGGVGSWCAEGLIRSGLGHLTLVDDDRVTASNLNRQSMATVETIGVPKVEALRTHLLKISPEADITALCRTFSAENQEDFRIGEYDYVIDAIDSLKDKAALILRACRTEAQFYSSMGAARKMDPTGVRVAEFWKVRGCPLGAALRRKFRNAQTFPARKFLCVYDEERLENARPQPGEMPEESDTPCRFCGTSESALQYGEAPAASRTEAAPPAANGALVHITGIFGFTLAGLVLSDLHRRVKAGA